MMNNKRRTLIRRAAAAALALISVSAFQGSAANAQPVPFTVPQLHSHAYPFLPLAQIQTLPATPAEEEAFRRAEMAFHFQLSEAPALLKGFTGDFPTSLYTPYATLMLGDTYFYAGEFPAALDCYNRLEADAFSGDIREGLLYRKGYVLLKSGRYGEARVLFGRVASSAEYGDAARFYIAYIDYVEEDYDRAYRAFTEIRQTSPNGAEAEYYINQIDYLRGEYGKVAKTSERLLAGNIPDEMLAETLRVGGLSYFKTGDRANARKLLKRYVDFAGDGAEYSALYSLGTILYDEGDHEGALPLFSSVTEFDGPLAQSSWLYIGQILTRKGDQQGAALAFGKAARENWDPAVAETAAFDYAVSTAGGSGLPFADTAREMEKFLDTYPGSPYAAQLSGYLANSYYNMHDYREALRQIDRISRPDATVKATRQKILYQLGVETLQEGKIAETEGYLKEASAPSAPDRAVAAQAALWLGETYYASKDYRKAVAAYTDATASGLLGENTALAYYDLGYAYMKLKDYGKAGQAYRKAIELNTLPRQQQNDARLRLGDCLYYTGHYSEALAQFREVKLEGTPDAVYARLREADILGRNGQAKEKLAILEQLAQDDAGIWRQAVISRLADAYSIAGDDRNAARYYSMIIDESDETLPQTYYSLVNNAENLYNAGDLETALELYRRIEKSGIESLYPTAALGITRTSADAAEIAEFAVKAASTPGLTADEMSEVLFRGAEAGLQLGEAPRKEAMNTLRTLAASADRYWGARAAVTLAETLAADDRHEEAEEVLTRLVEDGSSDNYWLARGYIALADVYSATDRDYLAKLYLESIRDNYPGNEKDIREMINTRLAK